MIPLHRILVPIDFGPQADSALRLACSLARDHGATVVLLYVQKPLVGEVGPWLPEDRAHLEGIAECLANGVRCVA